MSEPLLYSDMVGLLVALLWGLFACPGRSRPAFSFASLNPGFEEFKLFLGHTFSVFVAVLHHAEDGNGDQVGHKHEYLDPLNPSTNHLRALQDLQVGQELSCSVPYFAEFFEKMGYHLCFGLPAVVVDVQEVTGYGLSGAPGGARVAGKTVSVAGCYLTQGIMDALCCHLQWLCQ